MKPLNNMPLHKHMCQIIKYDLFFVLIVCVIAIHIIFSAVQCNCQTRPTRKNNHQFAQKSRSERLHS